MTAPLRKIVGQVRWPIPGDLRVYRDLLECGHVVPIKQDLVGETNAYRRRCKKCQSGKPFDIDPKTLTQKENQ